MSTPIYRSDELKLKIIAEIVDGKLTKTQARRIYGIKGKSSILEWMRKFASLPTRTAGMDPLPKLKQMPKQSQEVRLLQSRIKELEQQLTHSELKGRAYQIMVEFAKKKHGLDLEKKPGAKPSKNLK